MVAGAGFECENGTKSVSDSTTSQLDTNGQKTPQPRHSQDVTHAINQSSPTGGDTPLTSGEENEKPISGQHTSGREKPVGDLTDLAAVITAWPNLSQETRRCIAILALSGNGGA